MILTFSGGMVMPQAVALSVLPESSAITKQRELSFQGHLLLPSTVISFPCFI